MAGWCRYGTAVGVLSSVLLGSMVSESGGAAPRAGQGPAPAADVRLPSVAIGKTYSTWGLSQSPFAIRNDGSDTLFVKVEIGIPTRSGLCTGAHPLPDRSWVTLATDRLVVPPHSVRRTDVRLSPPYDPDLAGKTYQVNIWSTQEQAGRRLPTVRRCHRIVFRVEMDYRDDTATDFALGWTDSGARR